VRAALLAELGEAEWMAAGDPAAVIEHMREAAELTDDPAVRVSATITMARAIFSTGDAVRALATLLEALQSPAVLGPEGTVRLEAEFGSVGLLNFDLMPEARTRLLALRDQMGTDPGGEPLLLANFAVLAWLDGTAAETAAVARAALAEGRLLAESGTDTIAFLQAIWVLLGSDELDEARRWCAAGLAQARERGSAFGFQACCVLASMTAYRAGDLRESEAHARTGIDLGEAPLFLRPASLAYLALALIERGELEEAEAALIEGLVGEWLPPLAQMNIGFYARGLLRIAQGRDAEALEDLREFGRRGCCWGWARWTRRVGCSIRKRPSHDVGGRRPRWAAPWRGRPRAWSRAARATGSRCWSPRWSCWRTRRAGCSWHGPGWSWGWRCGARGGGRMRARG
jgi:hypothetical protein